MLIGLFLMSGVILIIMIILFLKPSVGDGKETLYVRFSNINRINVGTRVTFAGKPVGEVVEIQEIHDAREQPVDSMGHVYFYQLVLKVDSHVKVYDTDEIDLQTSGLLGEKSVAIIPRAPPKGVVPKIITTQPFYAESVDPIENAFYELSQVANEIEGGVREFRAWFKDNQDPLSRAVKEFGQTLSEANITIQSINQEKLVLGVKEATNNFSLLMTQAHDAMDQMHRENSFQNVGIAVNNIKDASHSMNIVMQDLADGSGTLGKLIKGDDMYLRVTAVMSKIDTLMNDINHYGLLFNLNKQWQRLRTQRVSFLSALDTPHEFKDYFTREVDQINTAMSRLSMLVDRAKEKQTVLDSDAFKKDFADLLRQVDTLSDNLRLYNQKFVEMQND